MACVTRLVQRKPPTAPMNNPPNSSSSRKPQRKSRHDDHSHPVSDALSPLLKKLGLQEVMWQRALLDDWPDLVGPQLARHTRPGRLDRKVLYVFVTHSMWLAELQRHGHRDLLANLQARYGKEQIRSVRLQLDPDVGRPAGS